MTEILGHLLATGRLAEPAQRDCCDYLARFGTDQAKAWAAANTL